MPSLELAVVDNNVLAALGMQQLLKDLIPMTEVRLFSDFGQLEAADEGQFAHYFVASRIYFEHVGFFRRLGRRAVVLVNGDMQIAGMPTFNVCQSETALVKTILGLYRRGHPQGHQHTDTDSASLLSPREIEVAILLAKGLINKEIADRLNIGLTTVITHRKNIMEKLHARSLADIIVYVIMNGLADVGEL
jgi:DNA-binding CsgD family transcriptional regulator